MDEAVNVVLCNSLCYPLHALNVDIKQAEVLGGIISTNQVEDHVRMADALLDGLGVSKIELDERNSPKVTRNFEMSLAHVISIRDDDLNASFCQSIDNVSAQEAIRAKDGRRVTS